MDAIAEIQRVLDLEGKAILECAKRLTQESERAQWIKALGYFQKSLENRGKIIVSGVGKSGKVGQKISATLCSTGSASIYLHPTEGLHGDLGLVREEDSVLVLSYTGNTEEVLKLVPSIRHRGVPIVGLGGNSKSQLAEVCDAWLNAHVTQEACPHNLAPTSSTTLALAVGDAIAMSLMQWRGFDSVAFAKNHPGGSLGRRLSLKIGDLMHRGSSVATVPADSPVDEVIRAATEKKLGAVLVVSGSRLLGMITDGDVRRALQKKEKFFSLTAQDMMTRNPTVVGPEVQAEAALKLMEDRPSQISVLPVVDENGNWLGIVRLHDLVRSF